MTLEAGVLGNKQRHVATERFCWRPKKRNTHSIVCELCDFTNFITSFYLFFVSHVLSLFQNLTRFNHVQFFDKQLINRRISVFIIILTTMIPQKLPLKKRPYFFGGVNDVPLPPRNTILFGDEKTTIISLNKALLFFFFLGGGGMEGFP